MEYQVPPASIANHAGTAVDASFDPYAQWLGFAPGEHPGNHYELLGLEPFETDRSAIAHAADVATARVRSIRPGGHITKWRRLLDELKEAKACLLEEVTKSAYDARLRSGQTPRSPTAAASPVEPRPGPPLPAGPPTSNESDTEDSAPAAAHAGPPPSLFPEFSQLSGGGDFAPTVPQDPGQPAGDVAPTTSWESEPEGPVTQPYSPDYQPSDEPLPPLPLGGTAPADGSAGAYESGDAIPRALPVEGPPDPAAPTGTPVSAAPIPLGRTASEDAGDAGPYDAAHRGVTPEPVGVTPEPVGATPEPVGVRPAEPAGRSVIAQRLLQAQFLTRVLTVVVLVLIGVVIYMLWQNWQQRNTAERSETLATGTAHDGSTSGAPKSQGQTETGKSGPDGKTGSPEKPAPKQPDPKQAKQPPEPKGPAKPDPKTGPKEKPEPKQAPVDPVRQQAFSKALGEVRAALSDRDMQRAKQFLDQARPNAQTPQEEAELRRLETFHDQLTQFWQGIRKVMGELKGMEEIEIADTRIIVVQSSDEELVVRAAGRTRRYAAENMPTVLVMVLANRAFANDAVTELVKGTFLLFDPQGDRVKARQLWEQAARGGEKIDELLPELERAPARGPAGPTAPPLPPLEDRKKIEEQVMAPFKQDFEAAKTLADKSRLAKRLFNEAAATEKDPVKRYVLFTEAEKMAISAGEPQLAVDAIEQKARIYTVDVFGNKLATLANLAKTAHGTRANKELTQNALALLKEAAETGRTDEARRLAALAVAASRESGNALLMKQAKAAHDALRGQSALSH